jgi:hypothetical protein
MGGQQNQGTVMTFDDPVKALHEAMASAVHRDLPDVTYEQKRWKRSSNPKEESTYTIENKTRRPYGSEVEFILFQQLWGSTALGYGGIGGQAMTYAYTVIAIKDMVMVVYFGDGGHLAYKLDTVKMTPQQNTELENALESRNMPDVRDALNKFSGAIEPFKGYIDE